MSWRNNSSCFITLNVILCSNVNDTAIPFKGKQYISVRCVLMLRSELGISKSAQSLKSLTTSSLDLYLSYSRHCRLRSYCHNRLQIQSFVDTIK